MIKSLSEFKDTQSIELASDLLFIILRMIKDPKNEKLEYEENILQMFTEFTKNNPEDMKEIFALLSEKDPKDYHCDGAEAMLNIMALANDPIFVQLFTTQQRKRAATSSVVASESTEE